MPSEVSARFVQGEIDNTGDLDLDWTWDLDYRIELMVRRRGALPR